jgi:predicted dehydrogenase
MDNVIEVACCPNQCYLCATSSFTMKALQAGKHVLCDKPIANNEKESQQMFASAQKQGLVLLEGWQLRSVCHTSYGNVF